MPVWRFQVSTVSGEENAAARRVSATLADFGVASVRRVNASRLYLIELPDDQSVPPRIARDLLTDPVVETCRINQAGDEIPDPADGVAFEVFFKPGVMDNVADSTRAGIAEMGITAASVRTGVRYEFSPTPTDADLAKIPRLIANDCIQEVIAGTKPILPPPTPPQYRFELRHVAIRDLDAVGLARLSRDGHLFLSPDEMRTIQSHYRELGRDPTDLELETLAQTWSEHCVHKTLKSAYVYRGAPMPGGNVGVDVEIRYDNLLRDTIARATDELIAEGRGPECLSVFVDNAGIIGFDDEYGIAIKVETHNHPSAIEPYGGAATGTGGVIRDVLGCGLGAKPVANTDVFCVAPPDWPVDRVPKGVIHPKTVLKGVVSGVRDYGNCMGIPTVNGAVHFDPRYLGNPLVYCGCVGLIPRNRIQKAARPGDAIVVLGGRTGRDGIHGATFSSAELTDTHEDEFSHAVQIGNPVEEKKVRDVVLLARDYNGQGCSDQSRDRKGAEGALTHRPAEKQEPHSNALAYFITYHTYGTWLHGTDRGSVDWTHNQYGESTLSEDDQREQEAYIRLKHAPVELNLAQIEIVDKTVREVCKHRGWTLHELNVRTNHVHAVVDADAAPERVMIDFKSYSTRRMIEADLFPKGMKAWARHGSTRYLWNEKSVATACEYVRDGQGADLFQVASDGERPPLPDGRGSVQSGSDEPRARCLFSAITDCGAGGLSSAIGEMAEETGANVDLDLVPLKYAGLRYDEIWISEAQERMVLSVPQANIDALLKLAADEDVEATVIGTFTDNKSLTIRYNGTVVGEMDMHFLHHGLPKREKVAQWQPTVDRSSRVAPASGLWSANSIKASLTDPTVASKHWIVRQFDHEVLAGSAVKPLTGPGEGPNDAAVVRPRLDSNRGVVLGCGLAPQLGDVDPYWMTIAAIDEAVRNCVCVGGDPRNMAILDNFCWPSSDDPHSLGALVRTCQACYDAAKAYGLPFISGKDSLNNVFAMSDEDAELVQSVVDERYPGSTDRVREQFERQPNKLGIPYTLLITAMSVIDDVDKCIRSSPRLHRGQSANVFYVRPDAESWNDVDLQVQATLHGHVADLIATGRVLAAHDVSDGGLSTALVEMAIGRGCSLDIGESSALIDEDVRPLTGYLLVLPDDSEAPSSISGVRVDCVARVSRPMNNDEMPTLTVRNMQDADRTAAVIQLNELRAAWRAPLDW